MVNPPRILIVGAGIAGLALARALQLEGVVPEIVERAPSWPPGGTGLYLPGNGFRALKTLGLSDTLLARAARISHQRILDHTGRILTEIDLADVWNPVDVCVGVGRHELHRVLLDGAEGTPIRLATTVTALSQTTDVVDVCFADSSTGTYDLVVGADGIHSSIRHLTFGRTPPRHLGQVSWRFLVDNAGPIKTWTVLFGHGRAFLAMPIAANRLYCYADLHTTAREDPTNRHLARLRALFGDFAEPVRAILGEVKSVESIHFAAIEEIDVETWVQGRVVLIGDAAHATSPNMAQGASMALEDALVLARMLATVASPTEALARFCERRRARVQWVRQRTRRRDRLRTLPAFVRNLAFRLAGPAIYRRDYRPLFEEP
jgi:2-polyprenyl-6-methoxyphenol hydroxylase-like FAD-dependent oxidoreductase